MAIHPFLAMTAAEIRGNSPLPRNVAWMACHFSPYGLGLSNLPKALPEGAILILDDITPPRGHDPNIVSQQLSECAKLLKCSGVLLDFQRGGSAETAALAKHLSGDLPCPVAVSDVYAGELTCPVFLPPVPPARPLPEHIAPWKGREIWLEVGLDGETITLTEEGAVVTPLPHFASPEGGHPDGKLHIHYEIAMSGEQAVFTLWRTKEDLEALLSEAESAGIQTALGLHQELGSLFSKE